MEKHKLYILSLATFLMTIVVWLSRFPDIQLEVYISLFVFCYFAVSAIFKPRRRMFDILGLALLISFSFIVALKVTEVLHG